MTELLIEASEVLAKKNAGESFALIDARGTPNALEAFAHEHIAGARYASLAEDLSDPHGVAHPEKGGRHPLPSPSYFGERMRNLGISADVPVYIYDLNGGALAASRLLWMLVASGHTRARVVNGGMSALLLAGFSSESGDSKLAQKGSFEPTPFSLPTISLEDLESLEGKISLLDARDPSRYRGESEPFEPVAGHIPFAINMPFANHLKSDGTFKSKDELREIYGPYLDGSAKPVMVSCGSGVTACHTWLALRLAGYADAPLFVGSYSQWSRVRAVARGPIASSKG